MMGPFLFLFYFLLILSFVMQSTVRQKGAAAYRQIASAKYVATKSPVCSAGRLFQGQAPQLFAAFS